MQLLQYDCGHITEAGKDEWLPLIPEGADYRRILMLCPGCRPPAVRRLKPVPYDKTPEVTR